jgi:predicted nucleic acid-binding protein
MVFLQGAARRESAAGACLRLLELDGVELYVSPQIVAELRDVMTRPRVRHKFPALTDDHVNWFLAALQRKSVFVPQVPRIFVYDRDPQG